MKMYTIKIKVKAFRCKEAIQTEIMIICQILEQVSHLNYLGNDIGYDRNFDIDVKLSNFQKICETINCIFKSKVCQDTKLKFHKIMAVAVLSRCV